jgi:HEAT repeat protein
MSPLVVASLFPWIAVAHGWSFSPPSNDFTSVSSVRLFAAYPEITRQMLPRRLGNRVLFAGDSDVRYIAYSYADYAAIEAYARTGGAEAAAFFREEYRRPKELAFNQALFGWAVVEGSRLTPKLILLTRNWDTRLTATLALGLGGDLRAIPTLLELAAEPLPEREWSDHRYAGGCAVAALVKIGTKALPALHRALESPKAELRSSATTALGRIGDRRSIAPLWSALQKEKDRDDRKKLILTLGHLGDTRVLPELLKLAEEHPGFEETAKALGALRKDPRALAVLRKWAKEGEIRGDLYARYGYKDLREDWEAGLRGNNGERFAYGLACLADPRSIPALTAALESHHYGEICEALASIGKPAIPALVLLLNDSDSVIRAKAAVALGMIGDPSALPHLNKLAERQPTDARSAKLEIVFANLSRKVRVP